MPTTPLASPAAGPTVLLISASHALLTTTALSAALPLALFATERLLGVGQFVHGGVEQFGLSHVPLHLRQLLSHGFHRSFGWSMPHRAISGVTVAKNVPSAMG